MYVTTHLHPYFKHERVIDFFEPIPSDLTGTATGDATATLIGADESGGPGLRIVAGATGGGYTLTGTAINPAITKAASVELEGITLTGENASFACGWVGASNAVEVVKNYNTGQIRSIVGGVTTDIDVQAIRSSGDLSAMTNGYVGVFTDFVGAQVAGHVNWSYASRAVLTANESMTFGIRIPSSTDFTVTIKRIRLTVWS